MKSEIGKMRFKGGVIKETKTKFLTTGNAITVLCVIIAPMFQKEDPVYEL